MENSMDISVNAHISDKEMKLTARTISGSPALIIGGSGYPDVTFFMDAAQVRQLAAFVSQMAVQMPVEIEDTLASSPLAGGREGKD